jgi:hypothetical protein
MLSTVKATLEKMGHDYTEIYNHPAFVGRINECLPAIVISVEFAVENEIMNYTVMMEIDNETEILHVVATLPFEVPSNHRRKVADFLMRINWTIKIGNFEMRPSNGEIAFRNSVDVEGFRVSEEMVENNLHRLHRMIQTFSPGIVALLACDSKKPEDAFWEMLVDVLSGLI